MQTKITQRLTALFLLVQVCSFFSFFTSCTKDLEDLGIPKKATLVFPANGADNIELFPTLRWSVPSEGSVLTTYEVYLGNTPNPSTKVGSITGDTSWLVTDALTSSTTYYWKVISRAGEKSDSSSIFSFTTTATTSVAVNSLTLGKTSSTLDVGKKDTFAVTVTPFNATNKNFTFSSSNPAVATVATYLDTNIVVTALSAGSTTITVTSASDASKSATFAVTVSAPIQTTPVSGLTLSKTTSTLEVGKKDTFAVTVTPFNATNKNFTFTSSNLAVATVATYLDTNIVVTSVSAGSATITVTSVSDASKSATFAVTVNTPNVPVTNIALSKASSTINVNQKDTFAVTVTPFGATNKNFTFSSSNNAVATVAKYQDTNLIVSAIGAGTANVVVTSADDPSKSATFAITVNTPHISVATLELSKTSSTMDVNQKDTLAVKITPFGATNKNFTFSSSNNAVATVAKYQDTNLIVSAIGAGTANVVVTSADDPSKSATFAVTVNAPVQTITVTGITLNKTTTSIAINGTEPITPTIAPENATNKNVTWTSANEAVATVNPNGVITVVASGTTTITATTQDGAKTASITVLALTSLDGSTSYRFANDGHTYYIVNQTKNWEDAMGIATGVGGHLVHINSAAEQSVIQSKINTSGFNFTVTVDDGGGARYLWIGASDKNAEGTWQWMTSTTAGTTFGTANASYNSMFMEWQLNSYSPTSSAFQNWGTSTSSNQQKEPDNYDKSQDVAAIALEGWPTWQPGFYGRAFQWNDLAETNMLPFIVEIDR